MEIYNPDKPVDSESWLELDEATRIEFSQGKIVSVPWAQKLAFS